jgi:adenylate cyclase
MVETRKLVAILAADVVGYSRLTAADEDRTLARLRALRSDLIDPTIAVHHGRVVKRTGDGSIVEFRSVVDAVRCAIEVQNGMVERNAGVPPERRIEFRIGIHLGDVVEESDGDLMGDGVNIAARLEGLAKPGTIYLSDDAYRQVRARLDLAVSDLGEQSLKNIALPMRVFALEVGLPAQPKPATAAQHSSVVPAKAGTQSQRTSLAPDSSPGLTGGLRGNDGKGTARGRNILISAIAGIAAVILIVAVAAWYFFAGQKQAVVIANAPAHLSIVVLPFANLSNDPSQDYFADGITENLTTDLSRIRNSFVIARNTAFTFKGKNVDAKEIGKELDVRYVLEGSVQRDGNRVRVNAQLIDAESGAHLWADRFENDLSDLFKLQDDVVARLANTLGYELVKAEAAKSAHSANPDAIDLTMRGWAMAWKADVTKETNLAARRYFADAIKLDPNDDGALAGIAYTYMLAFTYGWTNSDVDYETALIAPADKAILLNPASTMAYYAKGTYLFLSHRRARRPASRWWRECPGAKRRRRRPGHDCPTKTPPRHVSCRLRQAATSG